MDDERHVPGPHSLPLWSESFWFPFYDPRAEVGAVFRLGILPNQNSANVFVFLIERESVIYSLFDLHAPVPPAEKRRMTIQGLTLDWEKPLDRFRIRYAHGAHGLDVTWTGCSPVHLYPRPPGATSDEYPGHLEQGGIVTGTVTIGGKSHTVDCLGHRDHSWGGERDWSKLRRWNYVGGLIDRNFWFNAVRLSLDPESEIFLGSIWNGGEILELKEIRMNVATADGGARPIGVEVHLIDEQDREHLIVGEKVLALVPVQFGRTWVKDGITRYRYGNHVGYGILEHGYVEES